MFHEIYPDDVSEWLERHAHLIDVREEWEFSAGHIPGSINIPMSEVQQRMSPDGRPVVLICTSGGRSGQVAQYLSTNGFSEVVNLLGGVVGWKAQGKDIESAAD
mgnify:CR=1 FL=1